MGINMKSKICKDCIHYIADNNFGQASTTHKCRAFTTQDLVTGNIIYRDCYTARLDGFCTPRGIRFEPIDSMKDYYQEEIFDPPF